MLDRAERGWDSDGVRETSGRVVLLKGYEVLENVHNLHFLI